MYFICRFMYLMITIQNYPIVQLHINLCVYIYYFKKLCILRIRKLLVIYYCMKWLEDNHTPPAQK